MGRISVEVRNFRFAQVSIGKKRPRIEHFHPLGPAKGLFNTGKWDFPMQSRADRREAISPCGHVHATNNRRNQSELQRRFLYVSPRVLEAKGENTLRSRYGAQRLG